MCEAYTSIAALIGANGTLACDAVVIGKALALTCFPIAKTLVRTLGEGMCVVCRHYVADPCSKPKKSGS